jgi:hypothetical protein
VKIEVGSYVRISDDYPIDRTLQHQTGYIEALPNAEHPDDYLVKLDGGIVLNPHLTGRMLRINARYLEFSPKSRLA